MEIRQKILPPYHPDLIVCYANISQINEIIGKHSTAIAFYERLVQAREKTISKDHQVPTSTYNNIDRIYENKDESLKISSSKSIETIKDQPLHGKLHRLLTFRKKSRTNNNCNVTFKQE